MPQDRSDTPDFLTTREVAQRYGVHPATVRRWVSDGRLPAVRVGPRQLRIRVADLAQVVRAA